MYIVTDQLEDLKTIFPKLSDGADSEFLVDLRDMPLESTNRLTNRYGMEQFFRGESTTS